MKHKTYLFDFDGTLVDSMPAFVYVMTRILDENNIEYRPIVAGNFTKNKVIEYFDYSIYGDLKNSNILHNNGLFIGNHHFDVKKDLDEIYNLLIKLLED